MLDKITGIVKRGVAWARDCAAERDGTASSSRVVMLLVTPTVVGVLIAHVVIHHGLPAADQMYGLSAILATGAGAYATNKIRRDSHGYDDQQPPQQQQQQGGPQ